MFYPNFKFKVNHFIVINTICIGGREILIMWKLLYLRITKSPKWHASKLIATCLFVRVCVSERKLNYWIIDEASQIKEHHFWLYLFRINCLWLEFYSLNPLINSRSVENLNLSPIREIMQKLSSKCCHFKKHWMNIGICSLNFNYLYTLMPHKDSFFW